MRVFSLAALLVAVAANASPWDNWPLLRDPDVAADIRTPDYADADAPRYITIRVADVPGVSGDARDDLEAALSVLWLDIIEPDGERVDDRRAAVWGIAETEHGERQLAALLDGDLVCVLVATRADFSRLGGPAALGIATSASTGQALTNAGSPAVTNAPAAAPTVARPAPTAMFPRALRKPPLLVADGETPPGWQSIGRDGLSTARGRPSEPHLYSLTLTEGDAATTFAAAFRHAGITAARYPRIEEVDKYPQLASNRLFVTAGHGKVSGERVDFIATAHRSNDTGTWTVDLLYAKPEVLKSWDTALIVLHRLEALPDPRVLTPDTRLAISEATSAQQIELIEYITNKRIDELVQLALGLVVQQQMAVNQQLMQFNQSLSNEADCLVTAGCSIEYDGRGNAQMTFD